MHKILQDFEIQTNHPNLARRSDRVLINKKKIMCHLVDFAISADHRVKMKKKKNEQIENT